MSEDIFIITTGVGRGGEVDTGVLLASGGQRPGRQNVLKCTGQHSMNSPAQNVNRAKAGKPWFKPTPL